MTAGVISIDDYETVHLCRGNIDFSNEQEYKEYVGDFNFTVFPNPEDKNKEKYGVFLSKNLNIYNEISCTFIKALRDVASDLRSSSKNPLVKLLKGNNKSLKIGSADEIINTVNNLNNKIADLNEVKDIQTGIDNSIKQAVGTTYAPNIELKAELPNEMDMLLQSLKLFAGDSDDSHKGQVSELSLGGANLIYLSLKLLEYERVKTDKVANLLLIEEPEAHIHTHIQKTLFDNLHQDKKVNTQIIVSTHSTHISSVSKISSVNVLSRDNKKSLVFNPSNGLNDNEVMRIERYLDAVRSNLLFAKGVMLVEGDAEKILIPAMFKKVFGLSLDEIGISVINIGSTGFKNLGRIFHQDRVNRRCAILTDLDKAFIELSDEKTDDKVHKNARDSQKSGEDRKKSLEEFIDDNECIELFFAEHTFEVDMLMEGNAWEFQKTVDDVYKQKEKREISKEHLESSDISVSGSEVLKLANYKDKGWFALAVAEQMNINTTVPHYILEAIAWAVGDLSTSSMRKSAEYRLKNRYELTHREITQGGVSEIDWDWEEDMSVDDDEFIGFYRSEVPQEDPLNKLIGFIYDIE